MKGWLETLTPPEWSAWPWAARIAYVVTYAAFMAVVITVAHWIVY